MKRAYGYDRLYLINYFRESFKVMISRLGIWCVLALGMAAFCPSFAVTNDSTMIVEDEEDGIEESVVEDPEHDGEDD
ncbi:MAG: hypothetical protein NTX76_00750 [Alphaproteobacteria bacterium]|nr:hypothetical protein [Alphaproteobacteria bacterium]